MLAVVLRSWNASTNVLPQPLLSIRVGSAFRAKVFLSEPLDYISKTKAQVNPRRKKKRHFMVELVELLAEPAQFGVQTERLRFSKHAMDLANPKTLCGQNREGYVINRLGGEAKIEDPGFCPVCRGLRNGLTLD